MQNYFLGFLRIEFMFVVDRVTCCDGDEMMLIPTVQTLHWQICRACRNLSSNRHGHCGLVPVSPGVTLPLSATQHTCRVRNNVPSQR